MTELFECWATLNFWIKFLIEIHVFRLIIGDLR